MVLEKGRGGIQDVNEVTVTVKISVSFRNILFSCFFAGFVIYL